MLDHDGILVQPSKVNVIEGQFDKDISYKWTAEWEFDDDYLVLEALCASTHWRDTYFSLHTPLRLTVKQIAALED